MAHRTQLILIDDLDGKEIAEGGQTVTFSYQGTEYAIDLNEKNADKFERALTPFIAAARRTGGRTGRRQRADQPAQAPADNGAIREWARNNGYQVSDRGRVSQQIRKAYASR